ncbi:MAG: hypothetical protein ABSB91_00625 [Sedimentisphaerales bacterium]
MSVNLDGNRLFDETAMIEVESIRRESIERAAAGLDGVVSIDLGNRGRKILQKGELRARSKAELNKRIEAISAFIDGDTHTLAGSEGNTYDNVRMDSMDIKNERVSGSSVVADYEINYRQLTV